MWRHRALAVVAAVAGVGLAAMLASGCGSGAAASSKQVASVAGQPITRATVDHWVGVLDGDRFAGKVRRSVARAALALLISYSWLIGEAEHSGLKASAGEIRTQIEGMLGRGFASSAGELQQFLKATGETAADVELQARAHLAAVGLRRMIARRVGPVTERDVVAYYRTHEQQFVLPEKREARHTNRKHIGPALLLKREVEAGKNLTTAAQVAAKEELTGAQAPPQNAYERAIDSLKPHRVGGPFKIGNDYWLYEVVKVTPARQQRLSEVAGAIKRKLTTEGISASESSFVADWVSRWTASTSCSPGYVVPGCRQDSAPSAVLKALPEP